MKYLEYGHNYMMNKFGEKIPYIYMLFQIFCVFGFRFFSKIILNNGTSYLQLIYIRGLIIYIKPAKYFGICDFVLIKLNIETPAKKNIKKRNIFWIIAVVITMLNN